MGIYEELGLVPIINASGAVTRLGGAPMSQAVLDAMNKRQETQLQLQNAVEGLSIAVITYYGASLVSYLAKGAKASGLPVAPDLIVALSIPLIAVAVWWGVRRLHRRVRLDAS